MARRKRDYQKLIKGKFVPLTFEMMNSEAYKAMSPDGVWYLNEIEKKYIELFFGGKSKDENHITMGYAEYKGRISEYKFYKGRKEILDYGFYEEIVKGGIGHKPSVFRKDVRWKSISQVMKEKKDRQAQSERDKKRALARAEQTKPKDDLLSGTDLLDALLNGKKHEK